MDVLTSPGTVVIVEQNTLSSTAYMIAGSALIDTKIGSYTLKPGTRIMIAGSDISNAGTDLGTLTGPIDDAIAQNPLFIRNNGKDILLLSSSGSDS